MLPCAAAAGGPPAWAGPTQQEWEQVQQLLQQYKQQHTAMSSAMQQMQDAHNAAIAILQVSASAKFNLHTVPDMYKDIPYTR
jgi:hypothetical protein